MSNIAGNAYAMNVVTPMRPYTSWVNRLIFWVSVKHPPFLAGRWDQYVDSFSAAISGGLDKFWIWNIKYPKSVPMLAFHRYITSNQIWTDHYYNAYALASSNDVKPAKRVKDKLLAFIGGADNASRAVPDGSGKDAD
jgi:hypothetical protein